MNNIQIERGQIRYFGNTVGYVSEEAAIVDPMFQRADLEAYLLKQEAIKEVQWVDGVYDRLLKNPSGMAEVLLLKKCRIWQLKPDVDIYMKFIDYERMVDRFGEPKPESYEVVYDGEVDTNELEELYDKFKEEPLPMGYQGHALTLSDVIELYQEHSREYFYVDLYGFRPIAFGGEKPVCPVI